MKGKYYIPSYSIICTIKFLVKQKLLTDMTMTVILGHRDRRETNTNRLNINCFNEKEQDVINPALFYYITYINYISVYEEIGVGIVLIEGTIL